MKSAVLVRTSLMTSIVLLVGGCGGSGNSGGGGDVDAGKHAPLATSAVIETAEDVQSAAVRPSVEDEDAGDVHSFSLVTQPGRGTASVVDNRLVYRPDPDFTGSDAFTYRATDAQGASVEGVASVNVSAVNDAPASTASTRAVLNSVASSGAVAWVNDPDGSDTWSFQLLSNPSAGTASFNGSRWSYSSSLGAGGGTDSFAYAAADAAGASTTGAVRLRVYDSAVLTECTRSSTVNLDGTLGPRTKANSCAFYGVTQTRKTPAGTQVSMDHIVNHPSSGGAPKAVVVLIGGGDLNMNLSGDAATGVPAGNGGGNFVIRTAQTLAEAGYATVAIDRPSDQPTAGAASPVDSVDQYRLSVAHAVDILKVLQRVDTEHLHVFLAGTSRGAFSAVALNAMAAGISISSPVTSDSTGTHLYIGRPGAAGLSAAAVVRPVHVLWHDGDLCPLSTPAGSQAFRDTLATAGATVASDVATGGVRVTASNATVDPDVCGAFDFHGFLGIEPVAAGQVATWLDARVAELGANRRPQARFAVLRATPGVARRIDLSTLVRDADGDALTYAVLHGTTVLGGTVSVSGSVVNYRAPSASAGMTDYLVYLTTDGRGGVGAAVIEIGIDD